MPNLCPFFDCQAALKVVEAWVDEDNKNMQYGVDDDTALITAAAQGEDAEVEVYLDAGCDMQICNKRGFGAIASAACQGMDDCLKILLNAARERMQDISTVVNATNNRGETPLILARYEVPRSFLATDVMRVRGLKSVPVSMTARACQQE